MKEFILFKNGYINIEFTRLPSLGVARNHLFKFRYKSVFEFPSSE